MAKQSNNWWLASTAQWINLHCQNRFTPTLASFSQYLEVPKTMSPRPVTPNSDSYRHVPNLPMEWFHHLQKINVLWGPPPLNSWLRLRDIAPVGNSEWGPLVDLILPGPPVPPHWPTVVSDCEFFHEFFSLVGEPQTAELWWPALQANIGIDHNMETPNEMGKPFKFESYRTLTTIHLCLFSNDTFCSFKISIILSASG